MLQVYFCALIFKHCSGNADSFFPTSNLQGNLLMSLFICIACFEIVYVVLQRHKVGVKVRVITDKSMEIAYGSQNHRFMKEGAHINSNISQQVYLTFL
jgi:branched-subunit amino acid ABC-type transport system permease component